MLLAGCSLIPGIQQQEAIDIALKQDTLEQVTVVSIDQERHTGPSSPSDRAVWAVHVRGRSSRCVPGGGGCGPWVADATYYIDADTGEVIDGVTQLTKVP